MNALRLDDGFTREAFTANTGLPFSMTEGPVTHALDDGLLVEQGTRLLASERGQRYLNELLQYWMQEEPVDAGTC